jgi:hypothetical protein
LDLQPPPSSWKVQERPLSIVECGRPWRIRRSAPRVYDILWDRLAWALGSPSMGQLPAAKRLRYQRYSVATFLSRISDSSLGMPTRLQWVKKVRGPRLRPQASQSRVRFGEAPAGVRPDSHNTNNAMLLSRPPSVAATPPWPAKKGGACRAPNKSPIMRRSTRGCYDEVTLM